MTMEENVIIKSKRYNPKKLMLALIIIGSLVLLVASIYYGNEYSDYKKRLASYYAHEHTWKCHYQLIFNGKGYGYSEELRCGYNYKPTFWRQREDFIYQGVIPFVSVILLAFILKFLLSSYEMVVTDKRIYGKIVFGRRVDLPIDSISATGTLRILKGVSASTSSGRIKFLFIKNADQIYKEISNLLLSRQNKEATAIANSENRTYASDNLIKLKELLDKGIITQEEFEAKKKQFLSL